MRSHRPAALLLLLAALLPATSLPAQVRDSLVIERMDVEVVVRRSGEIEVTETLHPHFYGSWNGVVRDLSLRHNTARGRRERLEVELLSARDAAGNELEVDVERPDGWTRQWRVWVPGALDALRTVVVRYRISNAIRFYEEGSEPGPLDELYWNVTGNAWEVPIERASLRVILPEGVTATRAAAYTGPEGAQGTDATLSTDGGIVTVETTRRLWPGEGLTVGVGWPPGAVARPGPVQGLLRQGLLVWPLALPLLAFGFGFTAWRRSGKDPEARAITVQYQPPEGLTPAEVGTLVDHSAELHDITSTLVDLAVRGYLLIEEREEKKLLGLVSDKEYVFHFLRPPSEWGQLAPHEKDFLVALHRHEKTGVPGGGLGGLLRGAARAMGMGDGEPPPAPEKEVVTYGSVELSALEDSFYKDLPLITDAIYGRLIAGGYYRQSPKKVKAAWRSAGIVFLVVGVAGTIWVVDQGVTLVDPVALGAGGVLAGLILLLFAQAMPARTVAGARAREHALGFKEFLDRVESDRYRRMITGPEMFERYLPFALAFKVEKRWAEAFQDMFSEPPDWYRGSGGHFDTRSFTGGLSRMSTAAGSSMSSSPSSSGSGGGGSSGGGSGGGGGGGF